VTVSLHHLRIALKNVEPKVQREVVVPSDLRLDRLHRVLQVVMGWSNAHLHEFIVGSLRDGARYGPPQPRDLCLGRGTLNEARYTLAQIAPGKGHRFHYWYDFGDDWMHEIAVKAVLADPAEGGAPFCLTARGACPPEDCGGPWGYAELLEILADPQHPEYADRLDWLGGEFDPALVNIDAINTDLAVLARSWRARPRTKASGTTP